MSPSGKMKTGVACVIALLVISAVGTLPAAAQGCGKTGYSAEGYDTDSEEKALLAATVAWERAVENDPKGYGPDYAHWSRARQKHVKCTQNGPHGIFTCKVSAQPCP
jgi:hypothetical protein